MFHTCAHASLINRGIHVPINPNLVTNLYISAPPPINAVAPNPLYSSSGYFTSKWLNASICGYSGTFASKTREIRFANGTAKQGAGSHALKNVLLLTPTLRKRKLRHHPGARSCYLHDQGSIGNVTFKERRTFPSRL